MVAKDPPASDPFDKVTSPSCVSLGSAAALLQIFFTLKPRPKENILVLYNFYLFILCANVGGRGVHMSQHAYEMWRSEDSFHELVFFVHLVDAGVKFR